jgi:type II secretory pathway predicted ATPase ExeA/phage tail protein X
MPTVECADKARGQAVLLEFFGLQEQPFGVTPDPRFLYLTKSHREALASLIYAIETKRGFSALVAEPGMGKTTLLFYLLDKIKATARTAFLFRPDSNTKELLQSLLLDLGLQANLQDVPQMHEILNSVLLNDLRAGKHFVWVIDESQDLDNQVLESVRLLSNFETRVSKLMHIVLAGQPGLSEKLARPELLQLRQRVSTVARLEPLSTRETSDYIQHRARWAGCRNENLFSSESRELIAKESQGIPRNINNLCFSCLSLGFVEGRREIDPEMVYKVIDDPACETLSRQGSFSTLPPPASPAPTPSFPMWSVNLLDEGAPQGYSNSMSALSHVWMGIAFVGFLVVPILLVILSGNVRIRALEAYQGPLAEKIVTRVTGYDVHIPDLPETQPPALQPPKPPEPLPIFENQTSEGGLLDEEAKTAPIKKPVRTVVRSKSGAEQTSAGPTGLRVIYTEGGENLFQLALRYYGKSNWTIVSKIRSQNPQIKDSFTVFKKQQRVVLPDLAPEYPWAQTVYGR